MFSLKTIIFLFPLFCYVWPQKQEGYELPPVPSYVILTPQTVRPDDILKTSVTILKMLYEQLTIRIMIKHQIAAGKDKEYASTHEIFKSPGTRIVALRVPKTLVPGEYFIHVEGSIFPNSALIFTNRTKINFNPKQVSMFIQTCKPIYHQGQTVRIRVVPVKPNLMPVYGTLMTLEVVDSTGIVVRRWMQPMTNVGGVVEKEFALSDQIAEGYWHVIATHEEYKAKKKFYVKEYWEPRFDVNVTLPLRLSSGSFGVYGIVGANHTSSMPVKGNATIILTIENEGRSPLTQITRFVPFFEGRANFLFTMNEISQKLNGNPPKQVYVKVRARVTDWFLSMTAEGYDETFIYKEEPEVKFFGGLVRPYKPQMYFTLYIVISQPDQTPVMVTSNRNIRVTYYCETNSADGKTFPSMPIPDDGVISLTILPSAKCLVYLVQAYLNDEAGQTLAETRQFLTRYHSESGTYMQITTSTQFPRVNEYAVFHVKTNYPTNSIFYQIVAFGNIVYADTLEMDSPVMSRTFSVAISRDMAPIARIICFFVKQSGEIVSDSLTFFSNITLLNNVEVVVNRGKDLNVDTVEVIGIGTPGSWISLSAVHYDLYVHGEASILQDFNLIDEMRTFEEHSQQPFSQEWYYDTDYPEKYYYPSPSFGSDTNTTFNTSGVFLFTDANFTKVNFYHECNETEDAARAFPCYATTGRACFARSERCDGSTQCLTKVDEMNCPEKGIEKKSRGLDRFNLQYRHYVDAGWMWKGFYIKPDGRIQFRVDLPKVDTSWVVGAFAVDPYKGFSIQKVPSRFSGVRRFFITVECPEEAYAGEQIGVRIGIFNYWNYWAEALVEVQRSPDVRIVRVGFDRGWQGKINAFDPKIVENKVVQTLIYLEAGEGKYIHMPVLPRYAAGNTTFKICAYTFIGSNCEVRTVRIKMNGVTKYYHTGIYQDMTSFSMLYTKSLHIVIPQMFVTPEERQHRYVPGSQDAKVVIVGDVIGPSLGDTLSFADTESVLRMPHGAAENVIFELGYNLELLHYQWRAGYLPTEVMTKGLNYCNLMIQQSLSYYNTTVGGLSNFRETLDKPSVFPTAMAVWIYVLTGMSEWDKYIYIPKPLYKSLLTFIRSKQETTGLLTGSFPLEEVLDRKFKPIINDPNLSAEKKEALRRLPLTALVCLSVSEVEMNVPGGDPREQGDIIKAAASNFIKTHLPDVTDLFSKAIGTLALIRSSNALSADVITKSLEYLKSQNKGESNFYLADFLVPPPMVRNTERGQETILPRKEWPNDGYAVATTSLYFTMMMERNVWKSGTDEANTMVSWLATMRNHASGFASTFDSLLALKALKRYALLDNNRQLYKLQVKSMVTSTTSWTEYINIATQNYSTASYRRMVPEDVWGDIETNTEGTGKLLIQLAVAVNVEYESKLKVPFNPSRPQDEVMYSSFEIECTPQFSGRNNSIMVMKMCGRWVGTGPPLGLPHSGMAVYEVDIPTGYVSLNDELRRYVDSKVVPNLRYARYRPGKVHFYFDEITPEPTCISFRSDRFYPVANMTIELLCSAYEYYEPGRYNVSLYRTRSLNTMNICLVCGSYQCPFCPYYNAAITVAKASLPMILACVILVLARNGRLPFLPRALSLILTVAT